MSLSFTIENYDLESGCVNGMDEDRSPFLGVDFCGIHYIVNKDDYERSVIPRRAFRLWGYEPRRMTAKVMEVEDSSLLGEIERLVLYRMKVVVLYK